MAEEIEITGLSDLGGDVLEVEALGPAHQGIGPDNQPATVRDRYIARGWVSALTNHFDAAALEEDLVDKTVLRGVKGERHRDARAREMTPAEKREYCLELLRAQNPELRVKKPLAI